MMTLRSLSIVCAALALAAPTLPLGAQAAPPPPRRDSAPALLPPPPSSPRPETVAPRSRAAAQIAPRTETEAARLRPIEPRRISAPVDSARPTPARVTAPLALTPADPPPPRPVTPQATARNVVPMGIAEGPPPAGATARCRNGVYLYASVTDESCAENGGLAVRFPSKLAPPPPPRRP